MKREINKLEQNINYKQNENESTSLIRSNNSNDNSNQVDMTTNKVDLENLYQRILALEIEVADQKKIINTLIKYK